MKKLFLFILLISLYSIVSAQNYTPKDQEIFNEYIKEFALQKEGPTSQLIINTALHFLGTPYVAHTLEIEPEQLIVNLREFDCTTFVESVIALTLTLKEQSPSFELFMEHLKNLRYRSGTIKDYSSRIHYTSEWYAIHEKRGLIDNITHKVGGVPIYFKLNIISSNPDKYKQLNTNPELVAKIKNWEERASKYPNYYIKKEEIERTKNQLHSGDLVGFVTTVQGVDLSHVGIIYKQKENNSPKERLTFIHASSGEKKVVIEHLTLEQYTQRIKSNKGIIVVRSIF